LLVRKAGGAEHAVTAHLATPPDTPPKDQRTLSGRNPFNGATVINLSPAAADQLGLDPFSGVGVVVTSVDGGFAANLGLQPGDFIRSVNGTPIATVANLAAVLATPATGWTIQIERGGHLITAQIQG
jgi:S1-C subfamily serine protease